MFYFLLTIFIKLNDEIRNLMFSVVNEILLKMISMEYIFYDYEKSFIVSMKRL